MKESGTISEVTTISTFGSKYFGWLACLGIVLAAGWFLLPAGYNSLILWLSPELGNYVRPTMVMVNLLIVNPLNNWLSLLIWVGAGFIGGAIAGTKKGAFVVGLLTWLTCLGVIAFCVWQLIQTGFMTGGLPPIPPDASLIDVLSIPLVQTLIGDLMSMLGVMGGGGAFNPFALILPLVMYFVIPVVVVIIGAILGAVVRPKEEF